MSEFIVLGLIPGTHVQITFALWAIVVSILGAFLVAWLIRRVQVIRSWLSSLSSPSTPTRRKVQA